MDWKHRDRATARLIGLDWYYPDEPCASGNTAKRRTSNGQCVCKGCAAVYARQRSARRQGDLERARAKERAWANARYARNPEPILAHGRRWREANPDKTAAASRRFRSRPDYVEYRKTYTAAWRLLNREATRLANRAYRERNPGKFKAKVSARRAEAPRRVPTWFNELDQFVCEEAQHLATLRTRLFGRPWHVDHMFPLRGAAVSGLHCWQNLQVIPADLNLAKGNRMVWTEPFEWVGHLSALSS